MRRVEDIIAAILASIVTLVILTLIALAGYVVGSALLLLF